MTVKFTDNIYENKILQLRYIHDTCDSYLTTYEKMEKHLKKMERWLDELSGLSDEKSESMFYEIANQPSIEHIVGSVNKIPKCINKLNLLIKDTEQQAYKLRNLLSEIDRKAFISEQEVRKEYCEVMSTKDPILRNILLGYGLKSADMLDGNN